MIAWKRLQITFGKKCHATHAGYIVSKYAKWLWAEILQRQEFQTKAQKYENKCVNLINIQKFKIEFQSCYTFCFVDGLTKGF